MACAAETSPASLRLGLRPAHGGIEVKVLKRRGPSCDNDLFIPLGDMPDRRHVPGFDHAPFVQPLPAIITAGSASPVLVGTRPVCRDAGWAGNISIFSCEGAWDTSRNARRRNYCARKHGARPGPGLRNETPLANPRTAPAPPGALACVPPSQCAHTERLAGCPRRT